MIALLFWVSAALAYIPNSSFILENVAKNHGSGYYDVELEITFQDGQNQTTVVENWRIESDGRARLKVRSKEFNIDRLYLQNQIYWKEGDRSLKKNTPTDFFEPWFHVRSSGTLKKMLVESRVAPKEALNWDPKLFTARLEKDKSALPKSPVRLSRIRGGISYAFGIPTPTDQVEQSPGLWVEQDKFLIRKIRFPSDTTVLADDYSDYSKNLKFPKTRLVSWKNYTVPIRVISINWRTPSEKYSQTSYAEFSKTSVETNLNQSSAGEMIQEFYGLFR